MRFQLSQEQVDIFASLPPEMKQQIVDIQSHWQDKIPGLRPMTSIEDFDQVTKETYDFVSIFFIFPVTNVQNCLIASPHLKSNHNPMLSRPIYLI